MRTRAFTMADELVRAALADRLGEIRVSMRPQPVPQDGAFGARLWVWPPTGDIRSANRATWTIGCPLGEVGDTLWSREAWAPVDPKHPDGRIAFRADMTAWSCVSDGGGRSWMLPEALHPKGPGPKIKAWRSALQHKRYQSRLTYEITAMRCERLQHITGYGAQLSGFASVAEYFAWWDRVTTGRRPRAPRDGESVRENPWVFVASVRRVEVR